MNKKVRIVIIATLAVLVVAFIGLGFAYAKMVSKDNEPENVPEITVAPEFTVDADRFLNGITIGGIDVSGMTVDEARTALEPVATNLITSLNYVFTYEDAVPAEAIQEAVDVAEAAPEESETVTGPVVVQGTVEKLGISCNTQYVIEQAFAIGHDGLAGAELEALANDVEMNGRSFDLALEMDEQIILTQFMPELSAMIDREPVDATVQIDKEATDPEKIFTFTNAQTGIQVDQQALIELIREKLTNNEMVADIQIPVLVIEPQVADGADTSGIVLRSKAYTAFDHSPYNRDTRVFNIKKAVGLVNGTIVKPGEIFSANDTLGPRTYAGGWKAAPAIVEGGASEDQAGGGVCQVSTTIYNAVLMADLEIVYRQGHSSKLGYAMGGLDATINTGTIDFKWKNNTNSNVYVIMYTTSDKKVYCEIYGEAFSGDFDEIQLTSKKIATLSPTKDIEYREDKTKEPGYKKEYAERKNGSKWEAYKNYYKDGKLIRTEKIDTTTYPARNGIIIVGLGGLATPTPSPADVPTPTPSPSTEVPNPPTPSKKEEDTTPPDDTGEDKPSPGGSVDENGAVG